MMYYMYLLILKSKTKLNPIEFVDLIASIGFNFVFDFKINEYQANTKIQLWSIFET